MRHLSFAIFAVLALGSVVSSAAEIEIPLQPKSGIRLGQGFDFKTMTWKEVCVKGKENTHRPRESSADVTTKLSSVDILEELSGSLSGGLKVLGGLYSGSARQTYLSTSLSSDKSTTSTFNFRLEGGHWNLSNIESSFSVSSEKEFKSRCGTHVVVNLRTTPAVSFAMKILSSDSSFLERATWEMSSSSFWGLAKKSWTEEKMREAKAAQAKLQVSYSASGYWRQLLSPVLPPEGPRALECDFVDLSKCTEAAGFFQQAVEFLQKSARESPDMDRFFMDKQFADAAVLQPYEESSTDFQYFSKSVGVDDKVYAMNELFKKIVRLEAEKDDKIALGASDSELRNIEEEFSKLKRSLTNCEKLNKCQ